MYHFQFQAFKFFSYKIPASLENDIKVGLIVNAPFGSRNIQGIIVDKYQKQKFSGKIKDIDSILDGKPVIDKSLWKLTKWLSSYYNTPLGLAAKTVLPKQLTTPYKPPMKNFVYLIEKSCQL